MRSLRKRMFSTVAACCLCCFMTLTSAFISIKNTKEGKEQRTKNKKQKREQAVEHLSVLYFVSLCAVVGTMVPLPYVNSLNSLCLFVIDFFIDSTLFWFWLVLHRVKWVCVMLMCFARKMGTLYFIALHSYSWFNNYI